MNHNDEYFMRLALSEARRALGRTSPNPCVGAVVVGEGRVVATGYHERAGGPHAEVNALNEAGERARGATLYVTLEPCSHTGRTPPCCEKVAASGIARVVVGMIDPNPLVAGRGCRYLEKRRITVATGVLEEECRRINAPFCKYITSGLPLVSLKAGLSLDGRLNYRLGKAGWITGAKSVERVHRLRDRYDAILIGRGTAQIDNPSLTTRLPQGRGRDPLRLVLDSTLAIDVSARIVSQQSSAATWIFHGPGAASAKREILAANGVRLTEVGQTGSGKLDLLAVLRALAENEITSVLVEGGGAVFSSFLKARLADSAYLFYAPLFAGSSGEGVTPGLDVDGRENAIRLSKVTYTHLGEDLLVEGELAYPKDSPESGL